MKYACSHGNKIHVTKTDGLAFAKLQYIKIVNLE